MGKKSAFPWLPPPFARRLTPHTGPWGRDPPRGRTATLHGGGISLRGSSLKRSTQGSRVEDEGGFPSPPPHSSAPPRPRHSSRLSLSSPPDNGTGWGGAEKTHKPASDRKNNSLSRTAAARHPKLDQQWGAGDLRPSPRQEAPGRDKICHPPPQLKSERGVK